MNPNRKPSDPDDFGPGMKDDGTVRLLSPEDVIVERTKRDAEEAAFEDDETPGG